MKPIVKRFLDFKYNNFPTSLINEGLIKSYDYDLTVKHIEKLIKKYNYSKINIESTHLGIFLTISEKISYQFWNELKNILNICGYVISYYFINDEYRLGYPDELDIFYPNLDKLQINIIKRYDVSDDSPLPEFLYHITEKKYLNKILKNGLIPKSHSKIEKHPDRVYLLNNLTGALDFKKILLKNYPDRKFQFLKINTKLINNIKLYFDPTYFSDERDYNDFSYKAYYTYDNISPLVIKPLL